MRAVNLIPAEQRRGAGGVAGRAGGAVYVIVGGFAALVVMSVLYAISAAQVSDRQSTLTRVTAQAQVVQSQATALQPYVSFASIRQSREQAIASLTGSRFDWAAAMDQVARSLPTDVTLSALTGSPAAVTAAPAAAAVVTPGLAAAPAAGPSVVLTGCATSHSEVATVLIDLRRIVGVTRASLSTSAKSGAQTPAAQTAGGGACRGATFTVTLTYQGVSAALPRATSPQGGTTTAATSPTAGSIR